MVVNEGAGEVLEFDGRRFYTLCVGEKGVFRFKLITEGRAGHASMPAMGDNALLRMVEVLARLDGRQPAFDDYRPASRAWRRCWGRRSRTSRRRWPGCATVEPRLADQFEPMLGVTFAPTMIRASAKENVMPSRCTVRVDCRVPPGMGEDHVRRRVDGADRTRGARAATARVQRDSRREQLAAGSDAGRRAARLRRARGSRRASCCRWCCRVSRTVIGSERHFPNASRTASSRNARCRCSRRRR